MGTVTALRADFGWKSGQTCLKVLWKTWVQERENRPGIRWTGRRKRVGTGEKPRGGQGCDKEEFEAGLRGGRI